MSESSMVGPTRFAEYLEEYKDLLLMTRRNGILEVNKDRIRMFFYKVQ